MFCFVYERFGDLSISSLLLLILKFYQPKQINQESITFSYSETWAFRIWEYQTISHIRFFGLRFPSSLFQKHSI